MSVYDPDYRWRMTITYVRSDEPEQHSWHPNREHAEANANLTWADYGDIIKSITITREC